jgi:putative MATE family efflux protein
MSKRECGWHLTAPHNKQQSILAQLVSLSWPIILAFIMQTSYNIVDIFWVGKLGATAIAAVSLSGTVFYIILAIGQIIGSGTVALVSQSFGAQLYDRMHDIVKQSLLITLITACVVGIIGYTASKGIVSLLGGKGDVLILGEKYLRIVSIGFIFQLLSFSINYAFRGTGDMIVPMIIVAVATVINIVLDPLLILGIGIFPTMGVEGAALATSIAKCASFLIGLGFLWAGRSKLKLRILDQWHLEAKIIKSLLTVGVPAGLSYGFMFLSVMSVFRIVASFGDQPLAALGIGQRVLQFAGLPVVGIGVATTTMIGQSLGAHNSERATQVSGVAILASMVIMAIFSILFFLNASGIMTIFTDDRLVILHGVHFLNIVSFYLVFSGLTTTITGIFRGAGDMVPPMVAGLFKLFLLVGLALIFSQWLMRNVEGIWWAMVISYSIEGALMLRFYQSGRWRRKGMAFLDRFNHQQPAQNSLGKPRC